MKESPSLEKATVACALYLFRLLSHGSSSAGYYTYEGSDEPDVSDGRPSENVFTGNIISNTPTGIDLHQTDSSAFIGTRLALRHVVCFLAGFNRCSKGRGISSPRLDSHLHLSHPLTFVQITTSAVPVPSCCPIQPKSTGLLTPSATPARRAQARSPLDRTSSPLAENPHIRGRQSW